MTDSVRDKVAGLIVLRLGSNMTPARCAEDDVDSVRRLLAEKPYGGLILFNGRWPDTGDTLRALQRESDAGLLVMTDMERGLGQQVAGATLFPHLRAIAEAGEEAVRAFARVGAEEALACGIHAAFAPVADVNRNPRNPIISTRAFGDDVLTVEKLSRAYVESAREAGLLTTAKHFPGHGNTSEDSHAVTPVVDDSFEVLSTHDLPPFRASVDAGVDLVMTAHVSYPALDQTGAPATRSHAILHDLLRDWLGFDGVVISDSLHMGGIHDATASEADTAVMLLGAGVDLLLDLRDPDAVVNGVARAVEDGWLAESLLDASLARTERLRKRLRSRFGEQLFSDPSASYSADRIGAPDHQVLADRLARKAVRVLDGELPSFGSGRGTLAILVEPPGTDAQAERSFQESMVTYMPDARVVSLGDGPHEYDALAQAAREAERLLLAVVVRPAAWHRFGLTELQKAFLQRLIEETPTVLAVLGDPHGVDGLAGSSAKLCTFSDVPASRRALAAFLAESLL